ncbi:hypothetical protein FOZ63_020723 [Perkinsus olseni]|uniref:EF-hand domain-containing protein n=1 Tax=Perkinsus olseni TaxID=32597 RepID=A0A7J6S017_PEROL|nr:hypothetical protein FOZ62_020301 [Perkinsus olseni]KAF4758616.1 hypothetical protein FOZ63_020723 [Perkinsus olseni]
MGGRQIRSATANPLNDDEMRELFEQADLNGDGALNDRECNGFCDAIRMFHGLRSPLTEEFYAIVLDELDPGETGQIYLDDLKELYLAIWDERRVSVLNPDAPPPEIEDDEEAEGRQALEALAAELPPPTPAKDRFTANGEEEGQLHAAVEGSLSGEDEAASDGLGGRVGDDEVAVDEDAEPGSEEGVLPLSRGMRVADDDQEGGGAEDGLWVEKAGELMHDAEGEEGSVEEGLVLEKAEELIDAGEGGEQRLVLLEEEFVPEGVVACVDEGSPVPVAEDSDCLGDGSKEKIRASVTEGSEESEYCKECGRRAPSDAGSPSADKPYKILGDVPASFFTSPYNTHPWIFGNYEEPLPPPAYMSYQLIWQVKQSQPKSVSSKSRRR